MVPGRDAEKFPPQEPIVREIDEPNCHYTVCVCAVYCKYCVCHFCVLQVMDNANE